MKNLKWNKIISYCLIFILLFAGCAKQNNEITISNPIVTITPEPISNINKDNILIVIPEPQTINEYKSCYFTARCSKNLIGTWYFISPDWDAQYSIQNINEYIKELKINIDGDSIYLFNVPRLLDGWMIYCEFPDGLTTIPVVIHVNYEIDSYDPYLF